MRMLMLGGTVFLGRAVVDDAIAAGHEVTLLNRGHTNPGLYPNLENLVGNRDGDMGVLRGRSFDAVVRDGRYCHLRNVSSVSESPRMKSSRNWTKCSC